MLTKMRKKGKKGFTLVELIVVIAIIAILAAVAVPTTMHFVEKAKISNEQSAINYSTHIDGFFTNTLVTGQEFDMSKVGNDNKADNKLAEALAAEIKDAPIASIKFNVALADGKYSVAYTIIGKEYGDKGAVVKGKCSGTFTKEQIFNGATDANIKIGEYTYTWSGTAFTVTVPNA